MEKPPRAFVVVMFSWLSGENVSASIRSTVWLDNGTPRIWDYYLIWSFFFSILCKFLNDQHSKSYSISFPLAICSIRNYVLFKLTYRREFRRFFQCKCTKYLLITCSLFIISKLTKPRTIASDSALHSCILKRKNSIGWAN